MKRVLAALIASGTMAVAVVGAQGPAAGTWQVPRTPDGRPDLQGVWANNGVTPMERPEQWRDKATLTDDEVEELKGLIAQYVRDGGDAVFGNFIQIALNAKDAGAYEQRSGDGATGNYNHFWLTDRDWDNRTSLITVPANGRRPPLTPEAQERQRRGRGGPAAEGSEGGPRGRADSYEDRSLGDRCISFGAPRTGAAYNSYLQIVQSPETVVVLQEMIHDARIIPMTGLPHLPGSVRQLHGDSRGRWEGDTLVVETTNYRRGVQGSGPEVRLIERFTRVSPDTLNWEITPLDPSTWTEPWTFMIPLKRSDGQVYEYACHEGNYSMEGILAGARAEERAARGASSPTSR
jgi:hypothetical protein